MKKSKCAVLLSSIVLATGVLCGGIVGQSSGFLSELIAENTSNGVGKASYVLNISKALKNTPSIDGDYVVRTNSGSQITFTAKGLMSGGFKLSKFGSYSNNYIEGIEGYNRLSGLKNVLVDFEGALQLSIGTEVNGVISYLEPVELTSGVDYPVEFLAQYIKISALQETVINNISLSYSCKNTGIFYPTPSPVESYMYTETDNNPDEMQATNIQLFANKANILPFTDPNGKPVTRLGENSIHPAYETTYRYEIFIPKCYTSIDPTAFDEVIDSLICLAPEEGEEDMRKLYVVFERDPESVTALNLIPNYLNTQSFFSMSYNRKLSSYGVEHYVDDNNLLMRSALNEDRRPGWEVVGYQGNETFVDIPEYEILGDIEMPIYNVDNLYLGRKTLKVVNLPNSILFNFTGTSAEDPLVYLTNNERTNGNAALQNKVVFKALGQHVITEDGSIYATYTNSNYENVATLCGGNPNLKNLNVADEITINNTSYKVVTVGQNAYKDGSLESVTLGANIKTLETRAFNNNKITNFKFNDILETINVCALDRNNLQKVVFPNSIRRVEEYCLPATVSELVLNDGLLEIGNYAFSNITNLKEVFIPLSVTTMGRQAFNATDGMTIKVAASSIPQGWDEYWILQSSPNYQVLYNQTR